MPAALVKREMEGGGHLRGAALVTIGAGRIGSTRRVKHASAGLGAVPTIGASIRALRVEPPFRARRVKREVTRFPP